MTPRAWGVATLRSPERLSLPSSARFAVLLALLFVGQVALRPSLSWRAVAPDFYLIAVVFGALRWGPVGGALLGFFLGINMDAMQLEHFGLNGLALTIAGFALGKMKQSLYLDVPALDVMLLFTTGMLVGLLVTVVSYGQSFARFEDAFFYEVPLRALYTAGVGAVLFRVVRV